MQYLLSEEEYLKLKDNNYTKGYEDGCLATAETIYKYFERIGGLETLKRVLDGEIYKTIKNKV